MPSTYTHYRFGKEIYKTLPEKIKAEVEADKDLFFIGLHGPDILFYYKALKPNLVNRTGFSMHDEKARIFFERAADIIRENSDNQGLKSYIYGFICHFALDSESHSYIEHKIAQSGISHSEIETEFDKFLMMKDQKDPMMLDITKHILATRKNAQEIKHFFPQLSIDEVQESLLSMKKCNDFLTSPGSLKRLVISELLRISGNYKQMHGLMLNKNGNPECNDSNKKLFELYNRAFPVAIELMENYKNVLDEENMTLCSRFDRTYGPEMEEEWETADLVV